MQVPGVGATMMRVSGLCRMQIPIENPITDDAVMKAWNGTLVQSGCRSEEIQCTFLQVPFSGFLSFV